MVDLVIASYYRYCKSAKVARFTHTNVNTLVEKPKNQNFVESFMYMRSIFFHFCKLITNKALKY